MSSATASSVTEKPTVFDRSHWGRIRLTGADRVRFLHNQTTNNIEQLSPGQGCHSVFVTSTGRTIDLASVYALEEALLVVVSPGMDQQLYDWMDRYIFFSDKVTLQNESKQTFMFTVLGDDADALRKLLGMADQVPSGEVPTEPFSHQTIQIAGEDCLVVANSDLAMPGYTFIGPSSIAEAFLFSITQEVAQAGSVKQWEALRIAQGRPMPGQELTDDDNPLEAGLWHSISFEKGCYIGQETIARLNTYQGVKKRLWGLVLEAPAAVGAVIMHEGAKVGQMTSLTQSERQTLGLGYIRTKAGGEGMTVDIDGARATVVGLPFVEHTYYTAKAE